MPTQPVAGDPPVAGNPAVPAVALPRGPMLRLAAGVALLLLAVLLFAGFRLVAQGQRHSYDPDASPAKSYRLTAGRSYQLSSPIGLTALQSHGVLTSLACSWSTDGQLQHPLELATAEADDRDMRTFATFAAPATGALQVSCTRIDKVFIDDADDAGRDHSALLVLLAIVAGFAGVSATVSGGYALSQLRS